MADIGSFKEERKYKKLKDYLKKEREKEEEIFKGKRDQKKEDKRKKKEDTYREAEKARLKYLNDQLNEKLKKRNIVIIGLIALMLIIIIALAIVLI